MTVDPERTEVDDAEGATIQYESADLPRLPGETEAADDDLAGSSGGVGAGADGDEDEDEDEVVTAEVDEDQEATRFGEGSGALTATYGQETLADIQKATRRLGDFELVRKIGQGGMGEVWLANQVSLDRPVAVKVLPRSLATQENFIERFQREAKSAASLVHPNVIQIYAYGIDEGTPYFAMEYVEGDDLQQLMRRNERLDLREIAEIMIGVAAALQAAHEKGLIHRDVKPSNVMIDKSGLVKVMDFGLAKATSGGSGSKSLTSAGLIMGTPNYLSPEQGRGDPLDGRSDLYSLGIVLYELLTGALPFRADTPAGLIFKHVYEPPPPPQELRPELPSYLVEIVLKLLEKDPDDRYKNASELLADLHEFLDDYDRYVDGGERRPGAGYQDADRVAKSGSLALKEVARRRYSSERRKRASDVRNAVTEELRETSLPLPEEVAPAEPAPPARPEPPAPPRRRPPPPAPPARRSKALPTLALLVLLGAGGVYLHRERPPWLTDLLARANLIQPPSGGEGPRTDVDDPGSGPSGVGPVATSQPHGATRRVAFEVAFDLPGRASIALLRDGGESPRLTRGSRVELATGEWRVQFQRPGYETYTYPGVARLVADDDGRGRLLDGEGRDVASWEIPWAALAELSDPYRRARAAFDGGDLVTARQELEEVVHLDPDYRPDAEAPTATALLEQVKAAQLAAEAAARLSEEQLDGVAAEVEGLLEDRRWRAARTEAKKLAERRPDVYRQATERVEAGLAEGQRLSAAVRDAIERGDHAAARGQLEELAAVDPEHPERKRLGERQAEAEQRRREALESEGSEALDRLKIYLEVFGPRDDAARARLGEVSAALEARAARREREAELQRLVAAGEWEAALALAERLLAEDPTNAVAAEYAPRARAEVHRRAIESVFAALDRALTSGDLDGLSQLLDAAGDPAWYEREQAAFRDLLHPDELDGGFGASRHEVLDLEVVGDEARARTRWTFSVRLLGATPEELTFTHLATLRREDARWLFTGFRIPAEEILSGTR